MVRRLEHRDVVMTCFGTNPVQEMKLSARDLRIFLGHETACLE